MRVRACERERLDSQRVSGFSGSAGQRVSGSAGQRVHRGRLPADGRWPVLRDTVGARPGWPRQGEDEMDKKPRVEAQVDAARRAEDERRAVSDKTVDQLLAIPGLADEAAQTWGTDPLTTEGGRGRRVYATGPVLADLDRILTLSVKEVDGAPSLGLIRGWLEHVRGEMTEALGREVGLPSMYGTQLAIDCDWLARHWWWCEGRGWDIDMARDISRLHGALRNICKIKDEKGAKNAIDLLAKHRSSNRALTAQEAARELGVSPDSIYTWVRRRRLAPRYRVWDLIALAHPDLVALVEENLRIDGE